VAGSALPTTNPHSTLARRASMLSFAAGTPVNTFPPAVTTVRYA
jgi:hypothetical protein